MKPSKIETDVALTTLQNVGGSSGMALVQGLRLHFPKASWETILNGMALADYELNIRANEAKSQKLKNQWKEMTRRVIAAEALIRELGATRGLKAVS